MSKNGILLKGYWYQREISTHKAGTFFLYVLMLLARCNHKLSVRYLIAVELGYVHRTTPILTLAPQQSNTKLGFQAGYYLEVA